MAVTTCVAVVSVRNPDEVPHSNETLTEVAVPSSCSVPYSRAAWAVTPAALSVKTTGGSRQRAALDGMSRRVDSP